MGEEVERVLPASDLDEYLEDPSKTWTQPITDGESGTDFLAGIFPPEEAGGGC